jgi:hypothetical protein
MKFLMREVEETPCPGDYIPLTQFKNETNNNENCSFGLPFEKLKAVAEFEKRRQ